MIIDLEDPRLKASIRFISDNRVRLSLDYPREPFYRQAVREALLKLLAPPSGDEEAPNCSEQAE